MINQNFDPRYKNRDYIGKHEFEFNERGGYRCTYCNISLVSIKQVTEAKCLTYAEKVIKNIIE
jgi:hypothetical protein